MLQNSKLLNSFHNEVVMGRTEHHFIEWTRTLFFEHRTNLNVFIFWWSNTLFLASDDRTSNFEPYRTFTRFAKLLTELTWTSFFRTSDELKWEVILEHPILGFERTNIELKTLFEPSLQWRNDYIPTILLTIQMGVSPLRSTYPLCVYSWIVMTSLGPMFIQNW